MAGTVHACCGGCYMTGGERPAVFGRSFNSSPPLGILEYCQRPWPGYSIFQNNVGDKSPAAYGTEDAYTELSRFREAHQDNSGQEKQNALLTKQSNQFEKKSEKAVRHRMQQRKYHAVISRKGGVQPAGCGSEFQGEYLLML